MDNQKNEVDKKREDLEKLKLKLEKLTEEDGVNIDNDLHNDLASIIEEETKCIGEKQAIQDSV